MKRILSIFILSICIILPIIFIFYSMYSFINHGYIIKINDSNREIIGNYFDEMNSKIDIVVNIDFDNVQQLEYIEGIGDRDFLKVIYLDKQKEKKSIKASYSKSIKNYFKNNGYNYTSIILLSTILSIISSVYIVNKIDNIS